MPSARRGLTAAAALASRLARGKWTRYSMSGGTHRFPDARVALAAALGLAPMMEGPEVAEYERAFAEATGTAHAISFAAGRMSLFALLQALEIGAGDEVVLQAFTCVVVPNAIRYAGARPVYVDVESETCNIDPRLVEASITPRTRAIVAQHTFGLPCDVDALRRLAERHGILLIEDGAHALGASVNGRPVGGLGTAAFFSTDQTKIISTGTGGMVTTDDASLAARLREIQAGSGLPPAAKVRAGLIAYALQSYLLHPRVNVVGKNVYALFWPMLRRGFFPDEMLLDRPAAYPYPARLPAAQARLGLRQLAQLPANLAWRRHCVELFDAEVGALAAVPGFAREGAAPLRYTFEAEDRAACERWFQDLLDMQVWFTSVVHGRQVDLVSVGYQAGSCPNAERLAERCVNLPTHPRISHPELLAARLRLGIDRGRIGRRLHPASPGDDAKPKPSEVT